MRQSYPVPWPCGGWDIFPHLLILGLAMELALANEVLVNEDTHRGLKYAAQLGLFTMRRISLKRMQETWTEQDPTSSVQSSQTSPV